MNFTAIRLVLGVLLGAVLGAASMVWKRATAAPEVDTVKATAATATSASSTFISL